MPRFRDLTLTSKPSDTPRVTEGKVRERTVDEAALAMLEEAKSKNIETAFDRFVAQQPQCKIGYQGICCRICLQGPCRVKPGDGPGSRGICGANAYTIVARNLIRLIAGGAAAHSDHGKHIALALYEVAQGKAPDYSIKDPAKLRRVAEKIGISVEGKTDLQIAYEVADAALEDYRRIDASKPATWVATSITEGRKKKFASTNIMPFSINGNIVELISGTHMGMDADPVNLIFQGLKVALSDYDGSYIGTDLSDILFGTPQPVVTEANLGVLEKEKVNIIVHGHNPLLSEMMVQAAKEMEAEAKEAGATGVKLSGICCTGNEVLMRHGVPIATSFASQELAMMTGAVDVMIVDVQCIMPSIRQVAECYNTKIVTTQHHTKIPGAYHFAFQEDKALETAKEVVRLAIQAYKERQGGPVAIPNIKNKVVAGFSLEAVLDIFSKVNPEEPMKVVTDAILAGEIKGVAAFIGCNNLKGYQDNNHLTIMKEMAKNDVLILTTGCSAQAFAKHGFLDPACVDEYAGPGLKSFLKRLSDANGVDLPLAFHMGSCVDNTRLCNFYTMMANVLGVDTPKVPFVVSAPEAMSEKAVAIGSYNVSLGVPVHVGTMPPVEGSDLIYGVTTQIAYDVFGGYFILETDPEVAAKKLLNALEYRTWKLQVHHDVAKKFDTEICKGY
ncbi:anaerobic carbon-monoxide dehydrogenase catalytic subunit [Bacillota bacterium LX-D]|nr:anaerobic carbon-monoxide dehydrogenase catalytic subunit [Bacillota bacterium LX-D]